MANNKQFIVNQKSKYADVLCDPEAYSESAWHRV